MFTGIVREVGEVLERSPSGRLLVSSATLAPGIGASIAVNGVCLTVVEAGGSRLRFDVVPETFARTNLGGLERGARVNLEPGLTLEQPLDGHIVLGHVDGTATVTRVEPVELGRELTFELPAELAPYVAEKGSIAVDGTSLTVTGAGDTWFGVALIPHTLEHTVAGEYAAGTAVNVEVDVVARYVRRLLAQ